ncbi:MAG TPA: peptidase S10 [Terriglobales bacterium]|nr:peptidase S10 [Terriglobales bacterium]
MKSYAFVAAVVVLTFCLPSPAQEKNPPAPRVQKTAPSTTTPAPTAQTTPAEQPSRPELTTPPAERPSPSRPTEEMEQGQRPPLPEFHFDMTEVPPVVTHHQAVVGGKTLRYTATAGRLPIKNAEGKIEAEMFFVAYTLDGADPTTRPLTFAFNGGPGSASIWLHMGALGPRKVVLQPEGWQPAAPYRLEDNANSPLDRTDLVLVDAIGTGFSRPADTRAAKKFWGVKGDIESFSEFIRMYISRYERWSSPLFLFGESYGTTRSAGIAGYLANQGVAFNGITLLSTVLNFQTLEYTKGNDLGYVLTLPTYTMIAAYHHKLAPELTQDLAKTRAEVEHWALNDYVQALQKGDALTPQERQSVIDTLSRYTGLSKLFIDQSNLRVDVRGFTHNLMAQEKLRVGRLDGRFVGPDPNGYLDTPFYDPAGTLITQPFVSVFNDYVRRDLGYKIDMPYYFSARDAYGGGFHWEWGEAIQGFPDTATALRQAMVKDQFLKIHVMEGYYDLATPYLAANYTFNHLDLGPEFHSRISFSTFEAGHMVYLRQQSLAQMKQDLVRFMDTCLQH